MDTRIKVTLEFTISEGALEDAMAEYDELTVTGMLSELLDKAIACDDITTKMVGEIMQNTAGGPRRAGTML